MSSIGISYMSLGEWLSERKWSEIALGLEELVGLSTGRRCSLKRSLSRLFVSPIYTVCCNVDSESCPAAMLVHI